MIFDNQSKSFLYYNQLNPSAAALWAAIVMEYTCIPRSFPSNRQIHLESNNIEHREPIEKS
jgi:hypothetical protein